jgi:hypothetical protein
MASAKMNKTTIASFIEAADRAYPVRPDSSDENDEIFLTCPCRKPDPLTNEAESDDAAAR